MRRGNSCPKFMKTPEEDCFGAVVIVLLLLLACLSGCQYDPWAQGFLKKQPEESNVVGTYKVDADTLARHISVPNTKSALQISPNAEIVLSADHKASLSQVPSVSDNVCFVSGSGSWRWGRNDDYAVIDVQIERKDYQESRDKCGATYYGQLNLYGNKPPYKLHVTLGDPDGGEAVQFDKR